MENQKNGFNIIEFSRPGAKYKPLIRWWWPGLAVEKTRLKKEIELLHQAGFGGIEIQPFLIGGKGGESDEKVHRMAPDPYYYEILEYVLQLCSKLEMRVDLNIGSSWPPGGDFIDKENSLKTILSGTKIIKLSNYIYKQSSDCLIIELPKPQLPPYYKYKIIPKLLGDFQNDFSNYINDFKPIAVILIKLKKINKKRLKFNFLFPKGIDLQNFSSIDITNHIIIEENSSNYKTKFKNFIIKISQEECKKIGIFENELYQIFAFYAGPTGMHPLSDAKSKPNTISHVVDIINKNSIKILLETILGINNDGFERIKNYCGKTFKCLFTDSQEIACEWFWTEEFFSFFKQRRGYDIKSFLLICLVPNRDNQFLEVVFQNRKPCFDIKEDLIGERVRYDWLKTLSEIWTENYIKYISDYGKNYGLMHRIQTYGMPIDLIQAFGAADIPETETLFSGALDFFKIAGSAGILYNKKIVSAETFSWMRKDLMTNPIKWKVACDRLFVAGVNQIVYHGWTYQTKVNEFPPRYPWRSHGFSEDLSPESPYWNYYPKLNDYVTKIQYALSEGATHCDIGIFYAEWNYTYKHISNEDNEEGTLDGYDGEKIKGLVARFMRKPRSHLDKYNQLIQQKGHEIMEVGFYYIHFNEDILNQAKIINNSFLYPKLRALIFINCEHISLKSAEIILEAVQNGVNVIFINKIPTRQSGYLDYKENEKKIQAIFSKLQNEYRSKFHLIPSSEHLGKYLIQNCSIQPKLSFLDSNSNVLKLEPKISYICKIKGSDQILFIRSGDKNSRKINLLFKLDNELDNLNLYLLNAWNGDFKEFPYKKLETQIKAINFNFELQPYGSKLFLITPWNLNYKNLKNQNETLIIRNFELNDEYEFGISIDKLNLKDWNLEIQARTTMGEFKSTKYKLKKLKDWRKIRKIKYLAPYGVYKTEFQIPNNIIEKYNLQQSIKENSKRIILNLGRVQDIAEIKLNGVYLGSILVPPYKIDITNDIKINQLNTLEVKIIGTLQNLFIGFGKKYKGKWKIFKNRQLMPIGLIGPLNLELYKKRS